MGRTTRHNRRLTKDQVVNAALAIIKQSGIDGLTMRALAAELGSSPMAPYYYVETKSDLIRLLGNSILARVEVPPKDAGRWDERLRTLLRDQRNALKKHRGLREAIYPGNGDLEERLRLEDAEFDLLLEAGFEPRHAVGAYRILLDWFMGNAVVESGMRNPRGLRSPEKSSRIQQTALDLTPRLSADDYFEIGLDSVISALQIRLERSQSSKKRFALR
jgi:AcrR family transcriptional regulator